MHGIPYVFLHLHRFIRVSSRFSRYKQKHRWIIDHPILEVAVVALFTAAVSWLAPFASVSNSELVADLFRECDDSKVGTFCENGEVFNIAVLLFVCMITKIVCMVLANGISFIFYTRDSCGCWTIHTGYDCWSLYRSNSRNDDSLLHSRVSSVFLVLTLS